MTKIIDLRKRHKGKWFEVGYFCTNNPNEKINIVAKFVSGENALQFANLYEKTHAGMTKIIVR